jgi:hypothetical protein
MIQLRIDPEFRDKIPPLTDAEFEQLRENIISDGEVYEPIVVWNGTIVDGHNRYRIVQEHPEIPFRVKDMNFADKWAAFDWMYKKQLGRRNLTDEQKMYMIGKMYEARKNTNAFKGNQYTAKSGGAQNGHNQNERRVRQDEAIGKELGIGHNTVRRAEQFAKSVDAIREQSNEAAEIILQGGSGLTKNAMQDVHKMEPEQVKELAGAIEAGPEEAKKVVQKLKEPVSMESMNATPIDNTATYNADDFKEQVGAFPKEVDDMIRLYLLVHGDMVSIPECKKAFREALLDIKKVADKYFTEVTNS